MQAVRWTVVDLLGRTIAGVTSPVLRLAGSRNPDTLARISFDAPFILLDDGRTVAGADPFATSDIVRLHPDAGRIVTVHARPLGRGEQAEIIVRVLETSGREAHRTRFTVRTVPISSAAIDSVILERQREAGEIMRGRDLGRELRAALAARRHHPPVRNVSVARDGSVWLQMAPDVRDRGSHQWMVLSPRLETLGRARIPAAARGVAIDGPDLWAIVTDDLDVQYVVRYRIAR